MKTNEEKQFEILNKQVRKMSEDFHEIAVCSRMICEALSQLRALLEENRDEEVNS